MENSSGDVLFPTEDTEEEKTTENTEKKLCDFCGEILCDLCGKFSVFSVGNPLCSLWEILCDLCGKFSVISVGNSSVYVLFPTEDTEEKKTTENTEKNSGISVGNSL